MQKHYASHAILIPIFLFLLIFQNNLIGKDSSTAQGRSINLWDYSQIDVNNISAWVTNYGSVFRHPQTGNSGFEWPKGGGVYAIYASGLWMGSKVNNDVRVAVTEYSYEFGPGSIDPITHLPNDPNDPRYLVYKFNQGDVIPQQAIDDGCPNEVWGDQMLWSVYNDADPAYHVNMGTAPLGVEIQQTAFALGISTNPVISNLVFIRWLIINKGGQTLDSAYISIWSDPDLGDSGDDFVGCDTTLSLGYCYNSTNNDAEYGPAPPAVGYDYLQGPIVPSPGDSARFMGKWIYDYKNLPMTSFVYYENTAQINGNPQTGPEVYNFMQALWRDGTHMTYGGNGTIPNNPLTNFMFTGDPESGTGWLETSPADKRFMMSTGPFTMMPGDSQEIYTGVFIARGTSNLNSVTLLKQYDPLVKSFFLNPGPYSKVTHKISHPTTSITELQVQADFTNISDVINCELDFSPQIGSEPGFNLPLFDDGVHNDSLAGDSIWGNSITINNRKYPFKGDLTIYRSGGQDDYPDILNNLTLRPNPELINWQVTWENGQQDSSINHNEKVHLAFDLFNKDNLNSIDTITIINSDPRSNQTIESNQIISPGTVISNEIFYLKLYGPSQGDSLSFYYRIEFDGHTINLSSMYPVVPWNPHPIWQDTLDVTAVSGNPDNLLPIVADPNLLTGHQYRVTFVENTLQDSLWWRLTDITTTTILLDSAHIGESPDLDFLIIDGIEWKVFSPIPGFEDFQVVANASGPLDPPEGAAADWYGFPGIGAPTDNQQVGAGKWLIHCGGGTPDYSSFVSRVLRNDNADRAIPYDFEMRFTATGGWAIWAYEHEQMGQVPFELWNIGINTYNDPSDDYRMIPWILNEGITFDTTYNINASDHLVSSNSDDPFTDWVYWRNPQNTTPGTAGYDQFVADGLAGIYDFNSPDVMARMVLVNWNGGDVYDPTFPANVNQLMPEQGTVFRIITTKVSTATDTLLVTTPVVGIKNTEIINTFYLSQNYPNPFNPITNIHFSLAQNEKVKLEVFNVLGQKVKTLVNDKLNIGQYEIKWDGRNESGNLLGSGIYFYRLSAGDYIKTRKMIFLK